MKRLLILFGLMLLVQSALISQSAQRISMDKDGVIMISNTPLSQVYTIDISQYTFKDQAHVARYLAPYNDETMTALVDMEKKTITLTLNLSNYPDWSLKMWQSWLNRKARPITSVE